MEQLRLVNNVQQTRQPARNQPTPPLLVVTVAIIVALDICILADLLTGRQSGDCSQTNSCPTDSKDHWIEHHQNRPPPASGCFRAAVFENNRIDSDDYGQRLEANLAVYNRVAKIASENGANIIVFPEDGILMGRRHLVEPHLQVIPDPELLTDEQNNPCLKPNQFDSEILRNLSCVARENKLYVIANFGTRQNCEPGEQVGERKCPEKGFFSLNTDVVIDPKGSFIKRYRKYNLFYEIFDLPPALEEVYFDTPFGRFGIFTCFDILFKRPAIDLVTEHKVDTILFPTWWYDEKPILSAVLSQDAWSLANKVNLLAANVFRRSLGSVGSGIYSGNSSIHTSHTSNSAKLLIANVASQPRSDSCDTSFDPVAIEIDTGYPVDDYTSKEYELLEGDKIFTLNQLEDRKTICSGQVCCTIDYKLNPTSFIGVRQADILSRMLLIARDANRPGRFNWFEQVCSLATLKKPVDLGALNRTVYSLGPLVSFEKLSIKGTFQTKQVFPFAGHHVTRTVERKRRRFECHELANLNKCEHEYMIDADHLSLGETEIYSFGLYGRVYDRDIMPEGWLQ